jgi:ADP-ribose pyrophosphatase
VSAPEAAASAGIGIGIGTEPVSAFRVVGEQPAWSGRRISVAVAQIEGPDGERHEREIVHHPGAVGVVPLHDDGTVTLVCQYRVALDRMVWEVPAGLRDVAGEPTSLTAARELAEEAGLAATTLEHLLTFHNSPGFSDEALEIYLATGLSEVADDRQGPEEQEMVVERVPLAEALAMVADGRITDAKTVIGLFATARHLSTTGEAGADGGS